MKKDERRRRGDTVDGVEGVEIPAERLFALSTDKFIPLSSVLKSARYRPSVRQSVGRSVCQSLPHARAPPAISSRIPSGRSDGKRPTGE